MLRIRFELFFYMEMILNWCNDAVSRFDAD